tara:strand:- start:1606 stop:2178 length:573 start_codon:yes stop_codon:yes gene_type:complete
MNFYRPLGGSRAIVLDRDGVINKNSSSFIKSEAEWIPISGSINAIARLHQANFRVIIASNQSGLARGYFDEEALTRIHDKMNSLVEDSGGVISAIFYCPHSPDADCSCRKPKTGLLERAEVKFDISLAGDYFVGDSLKDLQAATSFNMKPILVRTGNGRQTESSLSKEIRDQTRIFNDLESAVNWILKKQ